MTIFHGLPFVFRVIMITQDSSPVAIFCVKSSITDRCFIRKSVEALITNEHYCLMASNIELKLSTNIRRCIDYRKQAQTFLSSHY